MTSALQINLKHYVENHAFDAVTQDEGVVVFIGAWNDKRFLGHEAHYVETYREARNVLGY